jgi:predicted Fe-S protein YdhL (DUF1289 family)
MDGRSPDSPCNKVCTLDAATQTCIGCGRTLEEIERWIELTPAQRAGITSELPGRRARFEARQVAQAASRASRWPATQCSRCGAEFTCGASDCSTPCWCASYPPVDPVEGRSCLCPACLAATRGK